MKQLPTIPPVYLVAGAAVAGALLWVAVKGPRAAGESAGGAAVNAALGVVTGGVLAVGDQLGIERTNMTECERAIAEGRTWDASFACPASTFLRYLAN
jgi:hypothetical protein